MSVRDTSPRSKGGHFQGRGLRVGEIALLAVPALWMSFHVPARNPVGIPHIERLVLLGVVVALVACLGASLLLHLTEHRRAAIINGVFAANVLIVTGGGMMRQVGSVTGWVIACIAVLVLIVLTIRMDQSVIPSVIVAFMAVFLTAGILTDAARSLLSSGTDAIRGGTVGPVQIATDGDVYLIVLDGFPGPETLAADFGDDLSDFGLLLESRGFSVPRKARAAYPATNYSIPSVLAMDYPSTEEELTNATLQSLYDVISGNNPVVQSFAESGYATYMIESGWSGSSCRHWFDQCIASPFLDDPMYHLLRDSLLTDFLTPFTGSNYPTNSVASMRRVVDVIERATNDEKTFVFAHVLAPHPPLMLDSDCSVVVDPQRAGYFFPREGVPAEVRKQLLANQIQCVGQFMDQVAESVSAEDVVIFVADHGTDMRGQLAKEPTSWTEEDLRERMNVLVAVKAAGMECPIDDDVLLPNVMRQVLTCLGSAPIPDVDERTYLFTKDF